MLKPFTAEDLCHAVRDAITRAADLTATAEDEIVRAHTGLSRLATALEELEAEKEFGYVVVNDRLEQATEELADIVRRELERPLDCRE